jgi:glycosyltransferase involved in cell wall biosynthesis
LKKVLFLTGNILNFDATPIKTFDMLYLLAKKLGRSILIAFVEPSLFLMKYRARKNLLRKYDEINVKLILLPRVPIFTTIFTLYTTLIRRIDVIHAIGHYASIEGTLVKFITKKKLVSDIAGLVPDERVRAGIWKESSFKYKISKILEKYFIEHADHVIVVSYTFIDYIKRNYNCASLTMIPSCVDDHLFIYNSERRERLREEHKFAQKFVVIFSGSLAPWDQPSEMINVFMSIKKKIANSHFLIITQNKSKIRDLLRDNNTLNEKDFTIKTLSHEDVPTYLLMGDVGLIWRDDSIVHRVGCPMKFAEYLACGLPVLASNGIGELADLMTSHAVGALIDPNDGESNEKTFTKLLEIISTDEKALHARCVNLAREYFSFEKHLHTFISLYKN